MFRSFLIICLIFIISISSQAQDKRALKGKNDVYKSPYPDDIERAKHMRPEFIHSTHINDRKKIKKENSEPQTHEEYRKNNIERLKDEIKIYESFPNLNEWEKAVILTTKANLAVAEHRYRDAINYLLKITDDGHITEKTKSRNYYDLYKLLFVEHDFINAHKFLMKAFSLKHPIMPWDFAILSEISFRHNKHADGVKLLTRAIEGLEAKNCPVDDKWKKILKQSSDSEYIAKLLSTLTPWFTSELMINDPAPILRKEPIYPRKAAVRGQSGYITLSGIVDVNGNIVCSLLIEGAGKKFLKPSQIAFSKFKYRPNIENGSPVIVYGIQTRFIYQVSGRRY